MAKKEKTWNEVRTFGEVKELAKEKGAQVNRNGKWDEVSTPKGTIFMTSDNHQTMDKQTKANLKRWMKLVGLMVLVIAVWYFWPLLPFLLS